MRPHLMNGQMLQRHQHYHQAWICTINFRDLVSILSSWLAGLNSNVMPQNRIFCLLATTHGKNSYWGISYNSGYESDILSMFIELYPKKTRKKSIFDPWSIAWIRFWPSNSKIRQLHWTINILHFRPKISFYTILHHITMVLRLHISRDESFTFLWAIGSTQNTSKWISLDFKARKGKGNTHWVPTCIPMAYHQPRRVHDSVFFPISLFHPLRWATLLSYSWAPNGGIIIAEVYTWRAVDTNAMPMLLTAVWRRTRPRHEDSVLASGQHISTASAYKTEKQMWINSI